MKKIRRLIIIALILLPVAAYAMIAAANNRIADDLEQALLAYPLPQDTEIMDSVSVAAKVSGNGNGMQYFGAILVKSELSEEELQGYYDNCCEKADILCSKRWRSSIQSMKTRPGAGCGSDHELLITKFREHHKLAVNSQQHPRTWPLCISPLNSNPVYWVGSQTH